MGRKGLVFAQEIRNPALPGSDFLGTCLRAGEFFRRHGTEPAFHGAYVFGRVFQGLGVSSLYLLFIHDYPSISARLKNFIFLFWIL
jgi:hypothetical protein